MASKPSTAGRRVYAIGDVHGYRPQLATLLGSIRDDIDAAPPAHRPLIIFLGDYVDRGPDSRGVIEAVLALEQDPAVEVVALRGNHEAALERFLADPAFAPQWVRNWGLETLASYSVTCGPDDTSAVLRERFAAVFPETHRALLRRLQNSVTVGDYLFVHAGVRPGVPLDQQDEQDLIWIRFEFLNSDDDFGKVVVHGHTPSAEPELRANRIGIDTGVYIRGVLTAVRLDGESVRFIGARG